MKVNVVRECRVENSPRVSQVAGMFDVEITDKSRVEFVADLPFEDRDWNVGLIVGPSGSGKTSLAHDCFGDAVRTRFDWPEHASILDAFPKAMSIKRVTALLNAVGFGTVPNWIRPFHVLSNGEQFRATVARALAEHPDLSVIDEFTSVVDRQVAKIASHCVQKTVRRNKQRFVAVSCHYDILEWLQPDWVFEPHCNAFEWRSLQRHPDLDLEIRSVSKNVWARFSKYHYLTSKLMPQALCIGGFIDDRCVAFSSAVRFPQRSVKNLFQEHRTVVLPEYQGLGIGAILSDWLGFYLWQHGWRMIATITHPAVIDYKNRSPRWEIRHKGFHPERGYGSRSAKHYIKFSAVRPAVSFRYTAPAGTPAPRTPQPLDELRVR